MKFFYSIFLLSLISISSFSQQITQSIRGTIIDKITQLPLQSIEVVILNTTPAQKVSTDEKGVFNFSKLPIGKYNLLFTATGYAQQSMSNITLNAAKEIVLTIEMEEKIKTVKEITIKAKTQKDKPLNDMATVSARMFSVEETNKYAGSLNDPARMAQNYAGVQSNGDTRNDIVIRGNSPLGVLWRLDGMDIPNPNHFAGIGTSGGAISILNNNNLSNSDFYTGAFPAQFSNATAGVFDLRLRNGNNKKHEYTAMLGVNGVEFDAEGPIKRKNNSSFMASYRYSTLEVFQALGINFGAASVPKYQDGTFKIHLPLKKKGTIDVFGIGGINSSIFYSKDFDTTGRKLNPLPKGFNTAYNNTMAATAITYTYPFSKKLISKATLAYTLNGNRTKIDSLINNEKDEKLWLDRVYQEQKINAQYLLNYKINTQHNTQAGVFWSRTFYTMKDSFYLASVNSYRKILNSKGNMDYMRAFVQHKYKFNDKAALVAGVNAMYFAYNGNFAAEPRIGFSYQATKKISLQAGAGIHHIMQPVITYFHQYRNPMGVDSATNGNLKFTNSKQIIIGANYLPSNNWRIKSEIYYQHLSSIPIEKIPSSYSLANQGAGFYFINKPYLTNKGTAVNYGVELTVEKFFSRNYYLLYTASIYSSKYKGSDGLQRHTAFDGQFATNILGGYEWKISKRHTIEINAKATLLGGRRYTPLNEIATLQNKQEVYYDTAAFTLRYPIYFRPDIKVAYRVNSKRITQEFAVNIDNVINKDNVQEIVYNSAKNKLGYSYQRGFFPIVQYRIEF
jgi:hypothetical protein